MSARKTILPLLATLALSSCSGLLNKTNEFGDARFTADYFLRDYVDFFFYKDRDYVLVGEASKKVTKGECVSLLNGKKGNSYRFYEFSGHKTTDYLVVNFHNKRNKTDKDYVYASKESKTIDSTFINFPFNSKITFENNVYVYFGETCQPLSKGNEVGILDSKTYYTVSGYSNWIFANNDEFGELYYKEGINYLDVDIVWLVRDIVVHE